MALSLDRDLTQKAEQHLSEADVVMQHLVKVHGPCPLANQNYSPFDTLVGSIISQQLSAKAADTIKGRIVGIVGTPFKPTEFLRANVDALRAAGLSGAKVRYVRELAERVADGRLSFDALEHEESESIISTLIEVPGVGRWTAEMFLIFCLKRPDVLAVHDAGLQRAALILYGTSFRSSRTLEEVSESWRPYRSVASWYLWQHLDNGE
jgi:DNA-3-methyladenine glycosylase II